MNPKITSEHLKRRAIIYVRQSTPTQLIHNQESQLLQYGLADQARELGFAEVITIDEDLGRTASGCVERPGFDRLVAEICSGQAGAVFCTEASRLARNGRDWHHLIDLCGLVGALVIGPEGIYDPRLVDDRLVLGVRGTMNEFELSLLRQRSLEAIRHKARRGELQFRLPVGYGWSPNGKIEFHPDQRIQETVRLVFAKMAELGSARQTLMWFRQEGISVPFIRYDRLGTTLIWKLAIPSAILAILHNPIYAGVYAFGRTEARTTVVEGKAHKTAGHRKPQETWIVLLRDHHPGYISWEQYERNQQMLTENSHLLPSGTGRKSGRGGRSLLAGLLRCRRCGRMLHVRYAGNGGKVPRYYCVGESREIRAEWCMSFGGLRPDLTVTEEILGAIGGNAIQAALDAAERITQQRGERRRALYLELEQARYEAQLAARRYETVDPLNRLVAAELESRWNAALQTVHELEQRLQEVDACVQTAPIADREPLLSLAQDLPAVWNSPAADMRLKQRIARILIQEIVADVEDKTDEIVFAIHWTGGRHSELRFARNDSGHHSRCTSLDAVQIVQQMAGVFSDRQIAATLNRLGLRTGAGNTWIESRIRWLRRYHSLPDYDPTQFNQSWITVEQASERLGVSRSSIQQMIQTRVLPATQVVRHAPWQIPVGSLDSPAVLEAAARIKKRLGLPRVDRAENQYGMFSVT
jgi:excisionase family DNA binding protein